MCSSDLRLAAYALVDGALYEGAAQLARRGPGVWVVTVQLPAGLGPAHLTIGATFDGASIVEEKTVPIATDAWTAEYPASIKGGCATIRSAPGRPGAGGRDWAGCALGLVGLGLLRRRRAAA